MEVRCLWGSSILPPARIGKPILTVAPPQMPLAPLRSADDDVAATFRWTNGITSNDAGGRPWIIGQSQNPAPARTLWLPHPGKVRETWNFHGDKYQLLLRAIHIFILGWPCIIYKFFISFPTWYTFIFFFYIYSFSLHVSDRLVHHQENQMFIYTCSLWHRSLGRWCVVRGRWC